MDIGINNFHWYKTLEKIPFGDSIVIILLENGSKYLGWYDAIDKAFYSEYPVYDEGSIIENKQVVAWSYVPEYNQM